METAAAWLAAATGVLIMVLAGMARADDASPIRRSTASSPRGLE
jgi:hypothetical protein